MTTWWKRNSNKKDKNLNHISCEITLFIEKDYVDYTIALKHTERQCFGIAISRKGEKIG